MYMPQGYWQYLNNKKISICTVLKVKMKEKINKNENHLTTND